MSSRKTVMSMSSEKREINPYAFEREVPPLNSSLGPPACNPLNRASSVQQTQKSFSTFCWTVPSRLPAPTNKSRRSFAEAGSTVANPGSSQPRNEPSDHCVFGAAAGHDDRRLALVVILPTYWHRFVLSHGILSGLGTFGFVLRLALAVGPTQEIAHDGLHPLREREKTAVLSQGSFTNNRRSCQTKPPCLRSPRELAWTASTRLAFLSTLPPPKLSR